jgi:hypothetical protein
LGKHSVGFEDINNFLYGKQKKIITQKQKKGAFAPVFNQFRGLFVYQ